jgi:dolichol-phosphate mannosyltransferase
MLVQCDSRFEADGAIKAPKETASRRNCPSVSVVVPTYREAENLPLLIDRIEAVREEHDLQLELILMDDDSQDGTDRVVRERNLPWITLVVRRANRGLSAAVLDGLLAAKHDVIVVMDADLSHPPERIPELLNALTEGAEFVIGSRYVAGAKTDDRWGIFRKLNSQVATLLARPFTRAADPMSGFFAFQRSMLASSAPLNPIGYKIGLELIVKCRVTNVAEIPIYFADRQNGESKLTWGEQLRYLQHLRRLFIFAYPNGSNLLQFLAVGASGVVVNLATLTALLAAGARADLALALAILISMLSNFALNRRLTFSYARHRPAAKQLVGFVLSCAVGSLLNYYVSTKLLDFDPTLSPQLASVVGILAGTAVNYLFNRFGTFRR